MYHGRLTLSSKRRFFMTPELPPVLPLRLRPDVGGGRHHVVVPLLVFPQRVIRDIQADPEEIYLQRVNVAEPEVGEIGDKFPSTQQPMRPSRWPGVLAFSMNS